MNIIKFIESFPDENSCREHFRQIREKEGIVSRNAAVKSIIGSKPSGSGNVLNAISGQLFAVGQ